MERHFLWILIAAITIAKANDWSIQSRITVIATAVMVLVDIARRVFFTVRKR